MVVGTTEIEPVTPAMSTQLTASNLAEIRAVSMSLFPFRSILVHANLGPTWGVIRSSSHTMLDFERAGPVRYRAKAVCPRDEAYLEKRLVCR